MKAYRTIACKAMKEITVKKSRFCAAAYSVTSVMEAQAHLEAQRKAYHDASHHCYAYIVGENSEHIKFSDDGEPQGTAGLPILDVIRKKELTQTLVVVTRYFGGILLGASGLVRAYSGACAAALDAAGLCTMVLADEMEITCSYPVYDRLDRFLKSRDVLIQNSGFGETICVRLLSRAECTAALALEIVDLCQGNATCAVRGQAVAPWPLNEANV